MSEFNLFRRRFVLGSMASVAVLPGLQGCAAPLPTMQNPSSAMAARALLDTSAAAHGLAAFKRLQDVSLRYEGEWRPLINSLQPVLADAGFRGGSEERLLLHEGLVAQAYTGPRGHKQVFRRVLPSTSSGSSGANNGDLRVWFNGQEAGADTLGVDQRAAAALVVDGYTLFLLGPMVLAGRWSQERELNMALAGTAQVNEHLCDVLRVRMVGGFGLSPAEQLSLFIDRKEHLMRRVRFTLDGLPSTVGAIAEVDTFDHITLHGVRWPSRSYEHLLRPLQLPVHDWRLTGLDVNRGMTAAELGGAHFTGKAVRPAAILPPL
jgi:hypothetical protein